MRFLLPLSLIFKCAYAQNQGQLLPDATHYVERNNTSAILPRLGDRHRSLSGNGMEMCVIGCAPYVRWDSGGKEKYFALVHDLVDTCDIIVHIGDTKAGPEPCTKHSMTRAVTHLVKEAKKRNRVVMYAPGDNEINDCYRIAATTEEGERQPDDVYVRAKDARAAIIEELYRGNKDLTGQFDVIKHTDMPGRSCDFDQYFDAGNYAVVTLEVVGSHWYLDDEIHRYPGQPVVDPVDERILMYENAKDCAIRWIRKSAERAYESNKRAVFFMLHASFYKMNGERAIGLSGIGPTWDDGSFQHRTGYRAPYDPLFEAFQDIVGDRRYKDMMFYVVHSDTHRSTTIRLFPNLSYPQDSFQNFMAHQIEGYTRGVSMFSRFTVSGDENVVQPVTFKEEWSRSALQTWPEGHTIRFY